MTVVPDNVSSGAVTGCHCSKAPWYDEMLGMSCIHRTCPLVRWRIRRHITWFLLERKGFSLIPKGVYVKKPEVEDDTS